MLKPRKETQREPTCATHAVSWRQSAQKLVCAACSGEGAFTLLRLALAGRTAAARQALLLCRGTAGGYEMRPAAQSATTGRSHPVLVGNLRRGGGNTTEPRPPPSAGPPLLTRQVRAATSRALSSEFGTLPRAPRHRKANREAIRIQRLLHLVVVLGVLEELPEGLSAGIGASLYATCCSAAHCHVIRCHALQVYSSVRWSRRQLKVAPCSQRSATRVDREAKALGDLC